LPFKHLSHPAVAPGHNNDLPPTVELIDDLQEGPMTDASTEGIKTVLHPVSDLEAAKAVYAALLGVPPQADSPQYVGFEAAGQQIGLVPSGGPQEMASPVAYWHVPDIEAKLAEVTAAGASVKEPPRDVGGGRLVATFTDPDGNVLGLLQDR
jgi:predicted enzyme related to lactoylglutathione lyase